MLLRVLACLVGVLGVVGGLPAHDDNTNLYLWHQRRAMAHLLRYRSGRASNVSSSALHQAQDLVAAAVAQQSAYNTYRVAHPRRNTYRSRPSGAASASPGRKRSDEPAAPELNNSLRAAAALLAEHHARPRLANGTLHRSYNGFRDAPRPLRVAKRDPAAATSSAY